MQTCLFKAKRENFKIELCPNRLGFGVLNGSGDDMSSLHWRQVLLFVSSTRIRFQTSREKLWKLITNPPIIISSRDWSSNGPFFAIGKMWSIFITLYESVRRVYNSVKMGTAAYIWVQARMCQKLNISRFLQRYLAWWMHSPMQMAV